MTEISNEVRQPPATSSVEGAPPTRGRRRRKIKRAVAVVVVAVTIGGTGAVLVYTDVIGRAPSADAASFNSDAPLAFVTVVREKLVATTQINGTLTYSGGFTVINWLDGKVTSVPAVGSVIKRGQVLYRVDGSPVVLLRGSVPSYRALSLSMKGKDVQELNAELVAFGYAKRAYLNPKSTRFGMATYYGVRRMQKALGMKQTGQVQLGQLVFQRTAELRVTKVDATYGAGVSAGSTVVTGTSTDRHVIADIDVVQSASIKKGDKVTVALPGTSRKVPATVARVGTVAEKASSGNSYTVELDIKLTNPKATGKLDQAPVQVSIETASVDDALAVPVTALLALSGGGFALEVVGAGNSRTLVPVELGMADEAAGMVQVIGAGVAEGQKIVVPAT